MRGYEMHATVHVAYAESKMILSSKVENAQQQSFQRKLESRYFNVLQKHWIPVFTGMTTFDEVVKDNL